MTKTHGTPVHGDATPNDLVSYLDHTYLVMTKNDPAENPPRTFTIVDTETGRRIHSNLTHDDWKFV